MKVRRLGWLAGGLALALVPFGGALGQVLLYPWLGLMPGLALTALLTPTADRATRVALGFALSPLLSAAAGWLLIRAGLSFHAAALAIAVAAGIACALSIVFAPASAPEEQSRIPRSAVLWAVGFGAVLLALPLLNPFLQVRSDSWLHGGIVMELLTRGMPPEDPRMAGLGLNYVWFFNLFIGLLSSLKGQEPFFFMSLLNVATGFATVVVVAATAQRLWNSARVTLGAVALLTLGLNAGAYLLWPVVLLRLVVGKVQGADEFARIVADLQPGTLRVFYNLNAPFAEMVSFLDKLTLGTALGYAYLLMLVFLWALVRWLTDGRRDSLAWALLAAGGMMFFHSVVGLSVIPVGLAVLALAWLLRARLPWLPSRGALAALAIAMIAGVVLAIPYTRSITAGWAPEKSGLSHRFLSFNTWFPWTLLTACFFPLWFARRPVLEAWRERSVPPLMLAAFAALMIGFACIVNLPENNFVKFIFECFVPLVLLAAPAFAESVERFWSRQRALAGFVLAVVFGVPALATLHGELADADRWTSPRLVTHAGEAAVDRWIETSTPREAVLVDRDFRDLLMVKARRRLYMGTDLPPERAAFPVVEMRARQDLIRDLYGGLEHPDSTVARLRSLGRPLYVLYRPEDSTVIAEPWRRLLEAAPGSTLDYERDGYRVVRLAPRSGT